MVEHRMSSENAVVLHGRHNTDATRRELECCTCTYRPCPIAREPHAKYNIAAVC